MKMIRSPTTGKEIRMNLVKMVSKQSKNSNLAKLINQNKKTTW